MNIHKMYILHYIYIYGYIYEYQGENSKDELVYYTTTP